MQPGRAFLVLSVIWLGVPSFAVDPQKSFFIAVDIEVCRKATALGDHQYQAVGSTF